MTGLDPISWSIILLLIGCGLVVLEVFIPSGGLISLLAGLALIASLAMAFRSNTTAGLTFLLVTLVAVPTAVGLAFKVWPMTPMGRAFLGSLPTASEVIPEDTRRDLIGKIGVAKIENVACRISTCRGQVHRCHQPRWRHRHWPGNRHCRSTGKSREGTRRRRRRGQEADFKSARHLHETN